jgi:hypothetical protein
MHRDDGPRILLIEEREREEESPGGGRDEKYRDTDYIPKR